MKAHCVGCKHHHNAKNTKKLIYNDWCCKSGMPAPKSIGFCKLNNAKSSDQSK